MIRVQVSVKLPQRLQKPCHPHQRLHSASALVTAAGAAALLQGLGGRARQNRSLVCTTALKAPPLAPSNWTSRMSGERLENHPWPLHTNHSHKPLKSLTVKYQVCTWYSMYGHVMYWKCVYIIYIIYIIYTYIKKQK